MMVEAENKVREGEKGKEGGEMTRGDGEGGWWLVGGIWMWRRSRRSPDEEEEEEARALAHAMSPHLTDRKVLGTGRGLDTRH